MRSVLKKAFLLASPALLGAAAFAVPAGDLKEHYQPIIERNAFGLKPPVVAPPPVVKPPEVPKPKVVIFLTGITTIGYPRVPKQAYLMTREQGKKDPTYYALPEEGGKDGITILDIDEQLRRVKVRTDEGEMMLSFDTHGITNATAAVASVPGIPGAVGIPTPPGSMPPALNSTGRPGRPTYNRNAATGVQTGADPGNNYSQNIPASTRRIPTRQVRVGQGGDFNGGQPGGQGDMGGQGGQEPPPDPALQYLQMRAQEEHNRNQGIPHPPTPPIPGLN